MAGLWTRRLLCMFVTGVATTMLAAGPVAAAPFDDPPRKPPKSASGPQRGTAAPAAAPTQSCSIYGSSSGFGLLCSGAGVGKTLAQLFRDADINPDKEFCWDGSSAVGGQGDPGLPDGFEPDKPESGPGQWWLHTCLTFDGAVLKSNARLTYEFHFHKPGEERELTDKERPVITKVTGRGQIPFLQVQTSPVSSPRVEQDVAFSLLCDTRKVVCDSSSGSIATPKLQVGGVVMFAELAHLRVLPEGPSAQEKVVDCVGAGIPQTAEQLDAGSVEDVRVCRHRYERSSNDAGGGSSNDRYPARVTAYWQIYVEDKDGLRPFGDTYEKTTVQQIRVTEVQTLVVS